MVAALVSALAACGEAAVPEQLAEHVAALGAIELPVQWQRLWLPAGFTQIDTTTELNGAVALFGLTSSGGVYYHSPGGDQDLGGWGLKDFSVARNQDGRLEVFAIGSNEQIYYNYQTAANSPSFAGWLFYGGTAIKDLAAGRHPNGRLGLYALGSDGYVYRREQTSPGAGWDEWQYMPGTPLTKIALATQASGKLMLLGLDAGGGMWSAPLSPTTGVGSYESIGGWQIQDFDATSEQDGRIHLFAVGGDAYVYEQEQLAPYGPMGTTADFGGWFGVGGADVRSTSAALNQDGRLQLLEIGTNGKVFDKVQQSAGGTFSPPAHLNGPVSKQGAVERRPDGKLEAYVITSSGELYQTWQYDVGGSWLGLPPRPVINAFSATPNPVRVSKPITLGWSVAQQCGNGYYEKLITTDPDGAVSEVFTHLGAPTRTVTPGKLGNYRFDLVAGCSQAIGGPAQGEVTQTLVVSVVAPPKPTVTLSVSPTTTIAGQTVIASWSISAPAGCTLAQSRLLVYEGVRADSSGNWIGGWTTVEKMNLPASDSFRHAPQDNTALFVVESSCVDGGYDVKNVPVTVRQRKIGNDNFALSLACGAPSNPGDPPNNGCYKGTIGALIPGGELISIKNTSGLWLWVLKWGHSTAECGDPDAVVTLAPNAELTDLSQMTGSSSAVPLPTDLLTCFEWTPNPPPFIQINATYSYIQ